MTTFLLIAGAYLLAVVITLPIFVAAGRADRQFEAHRDELMKRLGEG